jgi:hypothetical protein
VQIGKVPESCTDAGNVLSSAAATATRGNTPNSNKHLAVFCHMDFSLFHAPFFGGRIEQFD